jgi:predicted DNA-binding transcriptional regulator AlpA
MLIEGELRHSEPEAWTFDLCTLVSKDEGRLGRDHKLCPRIIRLREAPRYLGMDRNRFNAEVRPYLTEIPIGTQGIGFDRLELDAWVDDHKTRNGRPPRKGAIPWDANEYPASLCGPGFGISTNVSSGQEFARALAQLSLRRRNKT